MDDPYIAIPTIVIACVAVGISVWQGYVTRRHNKLSVKPILEIHTSLSKDNTPMGVSVENCGFGPAIINDFIVILDGKPTKVNNKKKAENIYKKAHLFSNQLNFWHPYNEGTVIKQGGTVNLITHVKKDLDFPVLSEFEEKLSHLHFKFIYESVYKEKFEASNEA